MNKNLKYLLGGIGILGAMVFIILGSFEPFLKAQHYIAALSNVNNVRSVQAFEDNFNTAFDFPSPVGAEETAKFISQQVLSIISQDSTPENVSRAVVAYIEPHIIPFDNDVVQLLSLSQLHSVLWQRFHQPEDYAKTENYLLKAYAIGPNLPPVLYSLADLYASNGDVAKFKPVAEAILANWPDDKQMRDALASIPASSSSRATGK